MPVAAIVFLAAITWKFDSVARQVFKPLIAPVALTGAAALLILSVGFVYGGLKNPFETAANRFLNSLPVDNELPYMVATGLRQGHIPKPLFMDWLTSDRPPLQSGMVLSQEPFGHPRAMAIRPFRLSLNPCGVWVFGCFWPRGA